MNDTLKQTTVAPEQFVTQRRIGSTLYRVRARFSERSRETLDDKIIRLIKNDLNARVKHLKFGSEIARVPYSCGVWRFAYMWYPALFYGNQNNF